MFAHVITSGTAATVQFFCENRFSGGFSPNRWNITPLWLYNCPVLSLSFPFFSILRQVELLDRVSRFIAQTTCFRTRKCLLGVTTIDDVIWGIYAPNPLKVSVNRQFQAKMPKYENCSISKIVNPIKPKFEDKAETTTHLHFVGGLPLP